jgi:hypothetical protein
LGKGLRDGFGVVGAVAEELLDGELAEAVEVLIPSLAGEAYR